MYVREQGANQEGMYANAYVGTLGGAFRLSGV